MPSCVRRLSAALAAVAFVLGCIAEDEKTAVPVFDLAPGAEVERHLDGGETHAHRVSLAAGDYLAVAVDQRGADVFVTLRDPDGAALFEVDSPNGSRGPEWVVARAESAGAYRLEVTAFEGSAGAYAVRLDALRPATEDDLLRARGADAFRRAETLRNAGSATEAIPLYRQALGLWESVGEKRWQALALERLGRSQADLEAWREAVAAFRRAEALFAETDDLNHRAITLGRLGQALVRLGHTGEALDVFTANVLVWRRLGDPRQEAVAASDLGLADLQLGELEAALEAYDVALPLFRRLGEKAYEATALNNLGLIHVFLGRYQRALDLLEEAEVLRQEAGDPRKWAITLDLLGQVYHHLDEPGLAREHLEKALALQLEAGEREGRAVTLANLALVARSEGRPEEALGLYREARAVFAELGLVRHEARVLKNVGAIHTAAGRPDEALDLLRRGLELQRQVGDPLTGAELWVEVAAAERRRGDLEAARRAFDEAFALHEEVRGKTPGQDLRASYFASLERDTSAYVDLLMELEERQPGSGHAATSLAVNERSRARSLLELFGTSRGAGADLLARERRLQASINAAARERSELGDDDPRQQQLDRELRARSEELSRVRGRLRAAGGLGDARPLAAAEIVEQVLDPETLLLEVHVGESRSFLWLLGTGGLETFELAAGAEIEAAARQAYHFLERSHRREAAVPTAEALCRLSRLVLAPVAGRLGAKRLLVVAGGALGYVPFAALPAPSPGGGCAAEPLLVVHEVVHLPSASTLAALRRAYGGRPPAAGTLAVVADPVFTPGSLVPLPSTRREARALLEIAGAERSFAALGPGATKAVVTSGALKGYRAVHFATHGTIDSEHPDLSSLALSELGAEGAVLDGRLRLHEIYGLELDAEVVVLSACRTALGREVRGEGLVGFVQGFFHAGARRVVVSLWDVDDLVTARLMEGFYHRYLEGGLPASAALRQAQLALWRDERTRAPYYWAGFLFAGEWK